MNRYLQIAAFVTSLAAISGGLAYMLFHFETYLERPLEQFALYAYLAIFITFLLSNATIIVPDFGLSLGIMLVAATKWNPIWVGVAASFGGALGELTGYYAGYFGRVSVAKDFLERYKRAEDWMKRYGPGAVFVAAVIPFVSIFDLVGMAAGALRMPLWKFLLACGLGKLPKYLFTIYVGAEFIRRIFPFWF